MKKYLLPALFMLIAVSSINAQYFLTEPCLSPDGKTIVFSADGDLWSVASAGGYASRITGMPGNEANPVFSPDGKWIAFNATQDGNSNIYVMPAGGGKIVQLTWHDGSDVVESWSWDSKWIYFTSSRFNSYSSYKVNVNGGTAQRLFEHYFNWPHNIIESPKTKEYIFNTSWESRNMASRKRYKGDFNPDLELYNPATKEYKVLTSYIGKDMWPTMDASANLYYVSDEYNNEYNLYKLDNGKPKKLTSFAESIKRPRVSSNGEKVVFEKDYQLWVYDVKTAKSGKVDINLNLTSTLPIDQEFNVKGNITNFDVSQDGKKIVFTARGLLFVSDIDGKFIRRLKTAPDERVGEVNWLSDNQTIIYTRTVKGWYNLFTIKADKDDEEKQITKGEMHHGNMTFNKDMSKMIYYSGISEMNLMDTKSFSSSLILKDEFWGTGSSAAHFSPDEKYILYTAFRNFEQDIFVYDFAAKKSYNLTNTGVSETDPRWSPDGKYIYFASDRYKPGFPRGTENADIFRMALRSYDNEFKSDRYQKLFADDKKTKKDSVKTETIIDFETLKDRWQTIAGQTGNQGTPYVIQRNDETVVLFTSSHTGDYGLLWQTILKPFDRTETKIVEGVRNINDIIKSKDNYYALSNGTIFKLDLMSSRSKAIDMDFKFAKNLEEEFTQMFYETWSNMESYYYDGNFHGADWNKVKKQYEKFLYNIRSRNNLRILLNDMLGELNSSHQGFSSFGSEENLIYRTATNDCGILFENDNPYVVDRIVKSSPADKVDKNVKAGDELIAVNGVKVSKNVDRDFYFNSPSLLEEITLTFKRGKEEFDVKFHPQPSGMLPALLYNEWIDANEEYVTKASDGKLAYMHMKSMGDGDLKKFTSDITSKIEGKEGIILDIRYNTGGNVHDGVLQLLSQRPYLLWKYRDGKMSPQPNFAPSGKKIILLVNEQTLSDGEMTSAGFKELGLGKVIGTETYRWIIFTSGRGLVDGSYHRMPCWGCYTLDGKDLEVTGVAPDIYIKNTFKDRLLNKDPQLDKAIETALQK